MRRSQTYSVFYAPAPGGGYTAYFPSFPEITVLYPTLRQCRKAAAEALELHISGLRALGEAPRAERKVVSDSISVRVG